MATSGESVAAVIVTYNRKDILGRALRAIQAQTRPLKEIIVVDNASQDGTEEVVRKQFSGITYLRMPDNLGPAGGFAAGMKAANEGRHSWIWLFNDDAFPEPNALEECLKHLRAIGDCRIGIVCPVGVPDSDAGAFRTGIWWRGRPVTALWGTALAPVDVDGVTFNGALLSRDAITLAGHPRSDFFIMFEEWEFCLRVRTAGFRILLLPMIRLCDLKAGSSKLSPPWRGYYQTRNHLAMVIERRSVVELYWWFVRQAKFIIGILLYGDRKWERICLRLLGAWHGVRGRMGRTIDPATYSIDKAG